MSFYVIGDEDTVLGFSLVGVTGRVAKTPEETHLFLREAMDDPKIQIILLNERLADGVREEVDKLVETMDFPLVIEIPDEKGPIEGRKTAKELVKSAVGIQL